VYDKLMEELQSHVSRDNEQAPRYMGNTALTEALADLVMRNGGDSAMEVPLGSDLWHFPYFTDEDIDDLRIALRQVA
jgi:hypothetical protein